MKQFIRLSPTRLTGSLPCGWKFLMLEVLGYVEPTTEGALLGQLFHVVLLKLGRGVRSRRSKPGQTGRRNWPGQAENIALNVIAEARADGLAVTAGMEVGLLRLADMADKHWQYPNSDDVHFEERMAFDRDWNRIEVGLAGVSMDGTEGTADSWWVDGSGTEAGLRDYKSGQLTAASVADPYRSTQLRSYAFFLMLAYPKIRNVTAHFEFYCLHSGYSYTTPVVFERETLVPEMRQQYAASWERADWIRANPDEVEAQGSWADGPCQYCRITCPLVEQILNQN